MTHRGEARSAKFPTVEAGRMGRDFIKRVLRGDDGHRRNNTTPVYATEIKRPDRDRPGSLSERLSVE